MTNGDFVRLEPNHPRAGCTAVVTRCVVALRHGRSFVGVELNPEYVELARRRIHGDAPLFNRVEVA